MEHVEMSGRARAQLFDSVKKFGDFSVLDDLEIANKAIDGVTNKIATDKTVVNVSNFLLGHTMNEFYCVFKNTNDGSYFVAGAGFYFKYMKSDSDPDNQLPDVPKLYGTSASVIVKQLQRRIGVDSLNYNEVEVINALRERAELLYIKY